MQRDLGVLGWGIQDLCLALSLLPVVGDVSPSPHCSYCSNSSSCQCFTQVESFIQNEQLRCVHSNVYKFYLKIKKQQQLPEGRSGWK